MELSQCRITSQITDAVDGPTTREFEVNTQRLAVQTIVLANCLDTIGDTPDVAGIELYAVALRGWDEARYWWNYERSPLMDKHLLTRIAERLLDTYRLRFTISRF